MTSLRFTTLVIAACALSCSPHNLQASPVHAQSGAEQAAPDNSKQSSTQTTTAENQSSAKSDRLITANVRRAVMADKSLSINAHNVKIITANGAVTLKGSVNSEDEKQKVATAAASVVSAEQITNQLTVKQ
jgi:hyperosmotically inducible periplasmic protein